LKALLEKRNSVSSIIVNAHDLSINSEFITHEKEEEPDKENEHNVLSFYKKYLFKSTQPNIYYIISIIDFLQLYNFQKFIESNYKFYIKSRPESLEAISSVPPELYCTRFINYVKKITDNTYHQDF
jgi:hypothetical protein